MIKFTTIGIIKHIFLCQIKKTFDILKIYDTNTMFDVRV